MRQQQRATRQNFDESERGWKSIQQSLCWLYTRERESEWERERLSEGSRQATHSVNVERCEKIYCCASSIFFTILLTAEFLLLWSRLKMFRSFLIAGCRAACMRERTKWACDRTTAKTQFLTHLWEIQQGCHVYSRVNITQYMRDALALLLRWCASVYIYMLYCTLSLRRAVLLWTNSALFYCFQPSWK